MTHPRNDRLSVWFDLLGLVAAVLVGAWVPVHLWLTGIHPVLDTAMEWAILGFAGASAYGIQAQSQQARQFGAPAVSRCPRFWQILDLLVAIPTVTAARVWGWPVTVFWLVKAGAICHLVRLPRILGRVDFLHPAVTRVIPMLVIVPLTVHWVATGWILLEPGPAPGGAGAERYVRAAYWAITTMATVGYGDITPRTVGQMIYACGVMVIGVGFFGFVLSNIASVLMRLDAAKAHQESVRDRVETFMQYHRVRPDLRQKVRAYLRYLWESRRGYDDADILASLPPNLRSELTLCINRDIVERIPTLKGASPELVRELILGMKPVVAVPGEVLFERGSRGDTMYFILRGQVDILDESGEPIAQLRAGEYLGEMALVTNRPRNATARAAEYCDLFLLEREAFERTTRRFPEFHAEVHATAAERGRTWSADDQPAAANGPAG